MPARVPSVCMGIDYEFMYRLHHSPLAFTYEEFKEMKRRNVSWIPWHVGGAIRLGANLCWSLTSVSRIFWLDGDLIPGAAGGPGEPAILESGRFAIATRRSDYEPPAGVPKRPVPHYWHVSECFPSSVAKERIARYFEKPPSVDVNALKRYGKLRENCEKHYNLVVAGQASGIWEPLSLGLGFGLVSRLWRKDRAFLREAADYFRESSARCLDKLFKFGKPKVVMLGDDYGYNEGLLMSKEMWDDLVKPRLAEHVQAAHAAGVKFILHSCGKIESLFKDLVEIGVDGVDSLSPLNNDLPALKRQFGDKIALVGTIDDTGMLKHATPAEVKSSVTASIRALGPGGYIPGATNALLDHPVENVVAMFEAIREFNS
nr:uroporphyrinogen decarboxylase family protein [Candidatus Sigynarchaeum springense]